MASIWDEIVAAVSSKQVPLESAVDQIEMMGFPRGTATKIATGELPMDLASREARRVQQNFVDDVYHVGDLENRDIVPDDPFFAARQPELASTYTKAADSDMARRSAGYKLWVDPRQMATTDAGGLSWNMLDASGSDLVFPDGIGVSPSQIVDDFGGIDDELYQGLTTDDVARYAMQSGASGAIVKNVLDAAGAEDIAYQVGRDRGLSDDQIRTIIEEGGDVYAITDPRTVRLEGAAFDPDNLGSGYLLGAVGNESPGVLDRATSLGGTAADLASQTWENMSLLDKAALVTSPIPFVGAGTGIAADVMNMVNNPEERTFLNAALLASNFIPGNKIAGAGMAMVDAGKSSYRKVVDTFTKVSDQEKDGLVAAFDQVNSRIDQLKAKDAALKTPSQMRNERYSTPQNLSESELAEYNSLVERSVNASMAGRTGASADEIAKELMGE